MDNPDLVDFSTLNMLSNLEKIWLNSCKLKSLPEEISCLPNLKLLSGTYTADTNWNFYDLSNVTLNIRDVNPVPSLDSNSTYTFTLMSVSDDNWVTTFGQKEFKTP